MTCLPVGADRRAPVLPTAELTDAALVPRSVRLSLVSFLIVRETGETDPSGLAHGFASKEHPTARPPTLRLK